MILKKSLKPILALIISLLSVMSTYDYILAETITTDTNNKYINISIVSEFPDSIKFHISSEKPIPYNTLTLKYKILGTKATQTENLQIDQNKSVDKTITIQTSTSKSYIPPGAEIEYWYELSTKEKNIYSSVRSTYILTDPSYEWQLIENQNGYIYFHDFDNASAKLILENATNTYLSISQLLGLKSDKPLRITVYNNWKELKAILPPRSEVQEESLITEGMSFGDTGVIVLLGNRDAIIGITMHETVHFTLRNAMGDVSWSIPDWLNEGLAEYANTESDGKYNYIISKAINDNSLFPITSLTKFPGKPDDVILAYGQSKSIVTFLINSYGDNAFQKLIDYLRQGNHIDSALVDAYGFNRTEIDNKWRESIGATKIDALNTSSLPTAIPQNIPLPSNAATFSENIETEKPQEKSCVFRNSNSNEISLSGGMLFLLLFHSFKKKILWKK
ncbi:MAG: hypothetical protein CL785_01270 [Chloroflexi bacterium]|nr:hypothetical protein [Chloroflexota bacterium]|tara:strand:- start:14802 stop:16145 length:1344 start_codon:yes stop_codon:yes gene_type:complete